MIELPTKIYIDKSPIHGWGVFAKELIKEGEMFEETPFVVLFERGQEQDACKKDFLFDYRFSFPPSIEWRQQVMPFGCGGIYNHSDKPNANWTADESRQTFKFSALRDIQPGEEIFTFYGPAYYWNTRPHIDVKKPNH